MNVSPEEAKTSNKLVKVESILNGIQQEVKESYYTTYPQYFSCFGLTNILTLTPLPPAGYKFLKWEYKLLDGGTTPPVGYDPFEDPLKFNFGPENLKLTANFAKILPEDIDNDGDGYTENQNDCNDLDADINPGETETCDGIDNDCDGVIDNGCLQYFRDSDGDGYGDILASVFTVDEPQGYVADNTDCNDNDVMINPEAIEICGDAIDQDCNSSDLSCVVTDADNDGYSPSDGDCNDNNPAIHHDADEICGDGIDQDCDGKDLKCPVDPLDVDNDGDGYTEREGDCDDSNKYINPGAVDSNGKDKNCDGKIDVEEEPELEPNIDMDNGDFCFISVVRRLICPH